MSPESPRPPVAPMSLESAIERLKVWRYFSERSEDEPAVAAADAILAALAALPAEPPPVAAPVEPFEFAEDVCGRCGRWIGMAARCQHVGVCERCREAAMTTEQEAVIGRALDLLGVSSGTLAERLDEFQRSLAVPRRTTPVPPAYLHCGQCGKQVSSGFRPVPTEMGPDLVVRAWIECPECLEAGAAEPHARGGLGKV